MAMDKRHSGHGGMSDMSGMGGMDMGSMGLFITDNKKIAHVFWYLVAATAVVRGLTSLIALLRARHAARKHSDRSAVPSRPTSIFSQIYDTILTSFREISYPTLHPFTGKLTRYFSIPSLGHSLIILSYWIIILIMLFTNVFLTPASSLYGYRWEKPAFRAAWVSVSQIPLVYALSCKINVISIVTGVSYERLNWMHRWVSRTLFLTLIVHWAYFFHEWKLAGFVKMQMDLMPMVKYGFGAWAVIGWTVLTGFGLFRDLCHELWVLQHLASAGVLLWLVHVHVPSYAQYNVWMAVGFVAFDRIARGIWSLVNNLHLRTFGKGGIGYRAEFTSGSGEYVKMVVKNVDFTWHPGQHVFLSVPACGLFQSHPFTIANTSTANAGGKRGGQDLEILLKCHTGFTKQLQRKLNRTQEHGNTHLSHRIFLSGPWGTPPVSSIERSNSLIFISSSTGSSYTLPLLEHAIEKASFVQRVCYYWIVRNPSQIYWHCERIKAALNRLIELGVKEVDFKIFVTGIGADEEMKSLNTGLPMASLQEVSDDERKSGKPGMGVEKIASTSSSMSSSAENSSYGAAVLEVQSTEQGSALSYSLGRPASFDSLIRPTVEAAEGETFIVACGARGMMAQVSSYVAALSDERAVHKGTGAQSIQLWTETYGW